MADYIKKNIISQAYIHVDPEDFDAEFDLDAFERSITEFVKSRTSFFLSPDAIIDVKFDEGSIKARVTIMGTILLLLQGIANYKDFREGIQLLYGDTRRLAEYIISESLFETKARHHNIKHLEARAGIIGSVQKVINQLEIIKRGAEGSMLASDISKKINEVKIEIGKLQNNITDEQDKIFVISGLYDLANKIPENPKPPKDKTNPISSVAIFRDERKKLIDLLSKNTVNKETNGTRFY